MAAIALAALERPFILEGGRASRCVCICVCVCVRRRVRARARASSFILQWNEAGKEDAPGGDQIITHLGSETQISPALPRCRAAHTRTHARAADARSATCMGTMYQCNERRQISFSFGGMERRASSTNACIYSERRGDGGGELFQPAVQSLSF